MPFHRGGHPGAVAVSYSASTMSPLSPSHRYTGGAASNTGSTSSATGGTTSKYAYRSSSSSSFGADRSTGYFSSATTSGYRTNSSISSASSDTYRRPYVSPARSILSYTEVGSIIGSSSSSGSSNLRYGSSSSSPTSSTASSTSSCGSRERNGHGHTLHHHHHHHQSPGSLATTAADLYARYSPSHYIPNIHGTSGGSTTTKSNGHWRTTPSSSYRSNNPSQLDVTDADYDCCRDRRDRSYSSESISGLSNANNAVSSSLADRWATRREAKRRSTPVLGNSGTALAGNAGHVGSPVTSEVTLIPNERNDTTSGNKLNVESNDRGDNSSNSNLLNAEFITSNNDFPAAVHLKNNVTTKSDSDDRNAATRSKNDDENNDNGYNINSNGNTNNHSDRDLINHDNALEFRRRRRRIDQEPNADHYANLDDHSAYDENDTNNVKNALIVARNNNDCSEIIELNYDSNDTKHYHHDQSKPVDEIRKKVISIPEKSSPPEKTSQIISPSNEIVASSSDSSSTLYENSESSHIRPSGEIRRKIEPEECFKSILGTKDGKVISSTALSVESGGSCDVGDADHHRAAYKWTKTPTNPDNTELLTNNNAEQRETLDSTSKIITNRDRDDTNFDSTVSNYSDQSDAISSGNRTLLVAPTTNQIDDESRTKRSFIGDNSRSALNDLSSFLDSNVSIASNDQRFNDSSENCDKSNGKLGNSEDLEESFNSTCNYRILEDCNDRDTDMRNGFVSTNSLGIDDDDYSTVPSASRRTAVIGWNHPMIDDLTGTTSSETSANDSLATNSPVSQNICRGISEQIAESSSSRQPTRNRLLSRRDERYGLNGLRNIGNTCFMNSVIQCLSNTRPLLEYLLNEQHLNDINTTTSGMKGALIKAFGQVIHELWEMSGDHVVNTTTLKSQIQRFAPRFMGYSQQDAQEFLRYLLEGLHEDVNRVTTKPQPILTDIPDHYSDSLKAVESWKRYLRSEDSMIVDVFVGQLRSSLHCTSCDHVSVTLDPFWDLSLPIPVRSGTVKLNQCFEHFTKVETLDGDEKPTCSKCQMRRKCTKSFSIQKFPKILVIHLKRFSPTERFRGKLSVLVDFPLTGLDLSAFAAPGVQGCTYNLYGIANHSGTTYSGHYTAYCKHPYSGEWHEYNDNRVSSVPARSVVSSEAYVLFYEQQPLSPHL